MFVMYMLDIKPDYIAGRQSIQWECWTINTFHSDIETFIFLQLWRDVRLLKIKYDISSIKCDIWYKNHVIIIIIWPIQMWQLKYALKNINFDFYWI